jgi:NNP family nitrate/nitrite transporter-like MFS transporter
MTTQRARDSTICRPLAAVKLKSVRVWRFGLYYFFVFGGFVALAQWLVPYYVNAYGTTVALAGALAACNSLPSGVIRAAGGWMSDRWGARTIMYWVFGLSLVCCALLVVPQMDIRSPGSGIMARAAGTVTSVSGSEIFGYLLKETGLWTSCWMFFFVVVLVCLTWMHIVIRRMTVAKTPDVAHHIE